MKKLQLSFSGGETSAYMTKWCLENLKDEYEMVVVFANTGEEREETLEFVDRCDKHFGFEVVWVEAVVRVGVIINERKHVFYIRDWERIKNKFTKKGIEDNFKRFDIGVVHKIVDFETASRNGEPFEDMIKKYGIPNQAYPHCTRSLKTDPMLAYMRDGLGWKEYYTAIGIRLDEFDRMNDNADELKFLYPLVDNRVTKKHINAFWDSMPFRLELKGFEGNCKACWKKSDRKLFTLALQDESLFDNMVKWEEKYYGEHPEKPAFYFYRKDRSAKEIITEANKKEFRPAIDDSLDTVIQYDMFDIELDVGLGCSESCEPF